MTAELFEKIEASKNSQALDYLRAKFQNVDEKVFFTDYTGKIFENVVDYSAVYDISIIEKRCENCCNEKCLLPVEFQSPNSRPVVKISSSPRGFNFLDVGWVCDLRCKFKPLTGYSENFVQLFRISGLSESQLAMTLENYDCSKNPELVNAKLKVAEAISKNSSLIIAGKRGTGKTHLAASIALRAMNNGKQAIFRLVNEMFNELGEAVKNNGDFYGLIKIFKNASCLIIDDLGHQNATDARMGYLHEIIDYRYRKNLQTILTTNAKNPQELSRWSDSEYILPIISRLSEKGSWITISNAEDFRPKKREVSNNDK